MRAAAPGDLVGRQAVPRAALDNHAFTNEQIHHFGGAGQIAAAVKPQVENQGVESLFLKLKKRLIEVGPAGLGKRRQPDIAHPVDRIDQMVPVPRLRAAPAAQRLNHNAIPDNGHIPRLAG